MPITRRSALVGGAAALISPSALAATSARRSFRIMRDGDDVGFHNIALTRENGAVSVAIDIEIAIRVLGIVAYRYVMNNREVWRDGQLVSLDSNVNDDGRQKRVIARAQDGAIMVDSRYYAGPAPASAATTTYFTPDFLRRDTWISTDSGELFAMSVARSGSAPVTLASGERIDCEVWRATNHADYDVDIFYDARGEWAGVAFDAGGEKATYAPDRMDESFAAIWQA